MYMDRGPVIPTLPSLIQEEVDAHRLIVTHYYL